MKPKASSSRNVKAQRKFAQGAYIPPSNQTVEQRRDVGHKQLNTKPVLNTQINMSAASLLDHVTFKNLYPHFQPIVLLERLDCSRLDCSRLHCSRLHCSRLDCSRLHCSRLHCSRLHCSSLENVRRKKRRSWSVSGDVRVGETRVLNEKHNNNKPDKQQRMTRSKSQCNTTIRSRSSIRVPGDGKERLKKHVTFRDDFSIDDNRPLTFFTSNATMKTRGSHVDSEAEPTKAKLPRTSSNEEKPDSVSEKLGQHSARRSRDRYKRDRINKAHTTTTVERDKDNSCRKRDKNNQDKETPNKNMSQVSDTVRDNTPLQLETIQLVTNNSCPGTKYCTAKDIISAVSKEELKNQCHSCISCKSINKILKIASLMEQPLSISMSETSNVYHIDINENCNSSYLSNMFNGSCSSSISSPPNSNSIPIYLDVMSAECTHMIQIIWDGDNDKILNARLVPKSLSNVNYQLSLNTHGNLLDRFIKILNESITLRICNILNTSKTEFDNITRSDVQWWEKKFKTGNNNSTTHESSIQPFAAPNKTQNFDEQQESLTRLNKMIAEVMEKVHRTQGDDIEMVEILSEQEEMIIDQVTPQQDAFEKLTTKINSSANNNKNRIIEEKTISTDTSKTLHMSKDNAMTPSKLKAKQKIARGNIVPDSGPRSSRKKTIESGNVVKTLRKSRRLNAIEKTLVKSVQTRRKSLSQASSLQNCTVARRKSISNPSLPDKYQSQTSTLSAIHLSKPSTSQNSTGLGQLSTQDNKDVENDQHDSDSSGQICGRLRWSTSSERTVIENKESETDYNNTKEVTGMRNHFPKRGEKAEIVNGLIFYPTKTEFADLLSYFQKIQPEAQNYGICKIVPPENFNPTCHMKDGMRFSVSNEYVSRLYKRWGWGQREMCAIKVNSATQGVVFNKAPLLDSTEVDLPKLYKSVQNIGGLKKVMDRKLWLRIAEELRVNNCLHPDRKLDCIYVKYVLGYDTLTNEERQHMLEHVESCWHKNNSKMMKRAMNPLHTKKKLLEETDSSEEEEDDVDQIVAAALTETEECVIDGRQMNLKMFKKISENIMYQHFPNVREPDPNDIEEQFWRIVLLAADHVCVNVASVDTGPQGYGFTKNKNDPYGRHAWNLKALCQNPGNILRSLSSVPGVTTPTLHLGMCFSCSCWHRDPHGLPWIEYMHSGPSKIWYGIPDEQSDEFRKAVEVLCPTSYRNKPIWLPSDITMIPPTLLRDNNVSLSRIVQQPGEFIIVFPKAYSCSINTGYTQSESAYFATSSWLKNVLQIFQELRESCEPSAFSLEQLLVSVARDQRVSFTVLQQVQESLTTVIFEELSYRQTLMEKGVKVIYGEISTRTRRRRGWNSRNDECDICRSILYLSKVVGIITKKSQVCLQHAIKLLNVRGNRVNVFQVEMILPFLDEELEDIVAGVVDRLAKL